MSRKSGLLVFVVEVDVILTMKALEFSLEVGISKAILEGNSKIIINPLKERDPSLTSFGHMIDNTKLLAKAFSFITFSHVRH